MSYYSVKINDKGNIAVDDTILVKDCVNAAGSKILDGFKSLFGAEAVDRRFYLPVLSFFAAPVHEHAELAKKEREKHTAGV